MNIYSLGVFSNIEVGHTYGKRRMRVSLNNQGYNIGIYQTATLMKRWVVLTTPSPPLALNLNQEHWLNNSILGKF
jgi:hypothetical protein